MAYRRPGREVAGDAPLVRGTVAQLRGAGHDIPGAEVEISSTLPVGEGQASSAALEVALALALLALAGEEPGDRIELARLCQRVESEWGGARTGLLDQLASLYGLPGHALLIDFTSLAIDPVRMELGGWRLGVASSGERRELAASGYNERRGESEQACGLLGVDSLRTARRSDADRLPEPLARRLAHVLSENERVELAVTALGEADWAGLGGVLDASHASLRDLYDASTEAVEQTMQRLRGCGAAGARMMGGGFGGSVLALFPPGVPLPCGVREVAPSAGARLIDRL